MATANTRILINHPTDGPMFIDAGDEIPDGVSVDEHLIGDPSPRGEPVEVGRVVMGPSDDLSGLTVAEVLDWVAAGGPDAARRALDWELSDSGKGRAGVINPLRAELRDDG